MMSGSVTGMLVCTSPLGGTGTTPSGAAGPETVSPCALADVIDAAASMERIVTVKMTLALDFMSASLA